MDMSPHAHRPGGGLREGVLLQIAKADLVAQHASGALRLALGLGLLEGALSTAILFPGVMPVDTREAYVAALGRDTNAIIPPAIVVLLRALIAATPAIWPLTLAQATALFFGLNLLSISITRSFLGALAALLAVAATPFVWAFAPNLFSDSLFASLFSVSLALLCLGLRGGSRPFLWSGVVVFGFAISLRRNAIVLAWLPFIAMVLGRAFEGSRTRAVAVIVLIATATLAPTELASMLAGQPPSRIVEINLLQQIVGTLNNGVMENAEERRRVASEIDSIFGAQVYELAAQNYTCTEFGNFYLPLYRASRAPSDLGALIWLYASVVARHPRAWLAHKLCNISNFLTTGHEWQPIVESAPNHYGFVQASLLPTVRYELISLLDRLAATGHLLAGDALAMSLVALGLGILARRPELWFVSLAALSYLLSFFPVDVTGSWRYVFPTYACLIPMGVALAEAVIGLFSSPQPVSEEGGEPPPPVKAPEAIVDRRSPRQSRRGSAILAVGLAGWLIAIGWFHVRWQERWNDILSGWTEERRNAALRIANAALAALRNHPGKVVALDAQGLNVRDGPTAELEVDGGFDFRLLVPDLPVEPRTRRPFFQVNAPPEGTQWADLPLNSLTLRGRVRCVAAEPDRGLRLSSGEGIAVLYRVETIRSPNVGCVEVPLAGPDDRDQLSPR